MGGGMKGESRDVHWRGVSNWVQGLRKFRTAAWVGGHC